LREKEDIEKELEELKQINDERYAEEKRWRKLAEELRVKVGSIEVSAQKSK
jgi:hypothetical protein